MILLTMMINEVSTVAVYVNLITHDSSPDFASKVVRPWLNWPEQFLWPCMCLYSLSQQRLILILP